MLIVAAGAADAAPTRAFRLRPGAFALAPVLRRRVLFFFPMVAIFEKACFDEELGLNIPGAMPVFVFCSIQQGLHVGLIVVQEEVGPQA